MAPNSTDVVENEDKKDVLDSSFLIGQVLAHPPPGEEVCITGISGVFPNSRDVRHLRDNLMSKTDMIDGDFRRWSLVHPEIPQRTGKIYDIQKFDAGFFGVHHRQVNSMDPMTRIFLEKTFEAIIDAGLNPSDVVGTKTGIFAGVCFAESEGEVFFEYQSGQNFAMTGCMRSMVPNRVSYFLKLKGPSAVIDSACSSSLYALENAYTAIRTGVCDMAIVGGANICLHPFVSLQFSRLGVLSTDGCCKSFDASGNGYCRSEAINCIFLQKAKDAKRIYSTVVHAKTNCDGFTEQGITYPSGDMQKKLLHDFYRECGIAPSSLSFLEAHGTGTIVGDPEEVAAIDDVFCKGRVKPLLVGSVKSNLGHSEPASGLCSVAKCIIGMEEDTLPPNLHYSTPREGLKALEEGRIEVVSEKTPFQDDRGLVGINSFGFGGANCHVLLKWNPKVKVNGGQPDDELPRLLCLSARVPEGITSLIEDVNSRKMDDEHIRLLQGVFRKNIEGHHYRGYAVLTKTGMLKSSWMRFLGDRAPLLLAFSNFNSAWQGLAKELLTVPIFAETIERIRSILDTKGIDITKIIENSKVLPTHHVTNSVIGTVALQLGIVDVLKRLEVEPDAVIGYALGELACGYFEGVLSLEQAILMAYEIGDRLKDVNEASMTLVVRGDLKQLQKILPVGVDVIWKNAEDVVTICGGLVAVEKLTSALEKAGMEILSTSSSEVTLHSKYISKIESSVLPKLKTIVAKPKRRSDRWISASTEKVASPEYFLKALHSQIVYQDLDSYITKGNVVLDIGTGQFSHLIKHAVNKSLEIIYFKDACVDKDGVLPLLDVLGTLYEYGFNPQVQNLYPVVEYPVSRGTPMISPVLKWDHSKDWYVLVYREIHSLKSEERLFTMSLKEEEWQFAAGHVVDGRNLFPGMGYLRVVWESLAMSLSLSDSEMIVVFENCSFKRAITINKEVVDFTVMIQRSSGNFEIVEEGTDIVSGNVRNITPEQKEVLNVPLPVDASKFGDLPLKTKDVYKELRLRGYNYKGAFKGIQECDCRATRAYIKWEGNWISFMDNMLQIQILQLDTRLLYVPTGIKQMVIDPKFHLQYVESFGENPLLPVYVSKEAGIIRCGGIEIRGLLASSIPRRRQRGTPVLEKYVFIPNETELSIKESLRVNMQIGLENLHGIKMKIVEVIDEVKEGVEPLGPMIFDVFADLPLIQTNISVFCKEKLELANVTVEDKELRTESDCNLIVGTKVLQNAVMLQQSFSALKEKAFILSREDLDFDPAKIEKSDQLALNILTIHQVGTEKLVYFRKALEDKEYAVINVSDKDEEFSWLPSLQSAIKTDTHVILYAQNEELSGLLGLFNCVRREPGGMNARCFLIFGDDAPPFDLKLPFYDDQLKKNMVVNIYKHGEWGTYRHLLLKEMEEVESEHFFINPTTRGDLSSLKWIEGRLNSESVLPPEKTMVQVYYASINFRDIMTASGRINADVITMDRIEQECVQGFEFCGRDLTGRRVMGMVNHGALTTMLAADKYLLIDIPDEWSMEDAATVPVVYATVIHALSGVGRMKKGESVLIHSGTGGVGQAAINYALASGCVVFTTVGTPEKRELIKQLFPQIDDSHIGNSRDLTFEKMVKQGTRGRGVDLVLNSLSEDKLLASVRCLAQGGRFLEIGKFDLASNHPLGLKLLERDCSFHGVMLDQLFNAHPVVRRMVHRILTEGVRDGYIKPLSRTVFKMHEIEQAFRHMISGKHTGKVMIQIREEEPERMAKPPVVLSRGIPRFSCDPERTYVICGGLGGFGLELADWIVLRGARRLVLNSRTGVQSGYQSYRLNIWKSYGTLCKISTADITTLEGCERLITEAQELGPIESVFNLAVVLRDALLDNQTQENFRTSFGPKAVATKYLDEVTRRRCPDLRDFVVFSSVSCGRGNAGQTNYGMSNSIMERICEQRKLAGFPALVVQWGAIGDVGLVAELMEEHTEMEIGGTLQQRITNCLQMMDMFLRQKEATIVASMLVAEKRSGSGGADNIVDAVANILGIKKQSVSPHTSLSELGMDSMTAVEIKQTLEREFEVFLTAQDIRSMTLARLQEIQDEKEKDRESGKITQRLPRGFELILRYLGDETSSTIPVLRLPSLVEDECPNAPYVFCFPGIEGFANSLKPLVSNVMAKTVGVQFCYKKPESSYKELAMEAAEQIEGYIKHTEPLHVVTYSWGTIIALETISLLEKKGYKGTVTCIDGAPDMLAEMYEREMKTGSDAEFETLILCHLMAMYLPYEIIMKNREKIFKCNTFEDRLQIAHKISAHDATHSPSYQKKVAIGFYTRLKELRTYEPDYPKIQSEVRLFKPSILSVQNFAEDYNLPRLCTNFAEIRSFEGNHITILENQLVSEAINEILGVKPEKTDEEIPTQETKEE
ncbi:hypothetical protein HHI36_021109 [Cryptolaemus montrouzieri]|uniref:Uncharacterized protein n=1 Tax=Cryptolaemus montrouzieri TaxID=559131 RepID=A0ABD2MW89_9CUCU